MGRINSGILRQPYRIRLDVRRLHEKIIDAVSKAVLASCEISDLEVSDYYIDDDTIDIMGNYTTSYKSEYWLATRESPEEYEIWREHISDNEIKINQEINLGDYISIHSIDEPEDEVEEIE